MGNGQGKPSQTTGFVLIVEEWTFVSCFTQTSMFLGYFINMQKIKNLPWILDETVLEGCSFSVCSVGVRQNWALSLLNPQVAYHLIDGWSGFIWNKRRVLTWKKEFDFNLMQVGCSYQLHRLCIGDNVLDKGSGKFFKKKGSVIFLMPVLDQTLCLGVIYIMSFSFPRCFIHCHLLFPVITGQLLATF